ncbi:MAG: hypothetical protein EPO57_07515 [Chitinophagaceae bacterium]|nr:MAG: hypothetical protein EPO57_07515 [Chitinophagaceae bacterium]
MKKAIVAILVVSVAVMSCTKNKIPQPIVLEAKTVNDLPADTIIGISAMGQPYGTGKYTLYSLENNSIVANSDSATTKWDIGFRGTTIIINSGTSGQGAASAFVYVGSFSSLNQVPVDSVFKIDNSPMSYAITLGSGKGWYNYDGVTKLISAIPGRVLVVRTATGKYAKVEILNYYKGGVTPDVTASDMDKLIKQRFYTFRYIYQPDGSKGF